MARTSSKRTPATSAPKTRQGQRQTSFRKTTTRQSMKAPKMPHEQERGESKSRPGARDEKRRRTRGENMQQEKSGKAPRSTQALWDESDENKPARGTRTKLGRRKARTGKSTRSGSRRSRSAGTAKNTRSSATGTRRRQTGKKSGSKARTSRSRR
jgi:hypothetical protein